MEDKPKRKRIPVHVDSQRILDNREAENAKSKEVVDWLSEAGTNLGTLTSISQGTFKPAKKVLNNLAELSTVIAVEKDKGYTWNQAEDTAITKGYPIRRSIWTKGDILFYRPSGFKQMKPDNDNKSFYEPLTIEYLKSVGITKFSISNHWNRLYTGSEVKGERCSHLKVGYIPGKLDKEAEDWEILCKVETK